MQNPQAGHTSGPNIGLTPYKSPSPWHQPAKQRRIEDRHSRTSSVADVWHLLECAASVTAHAYLMLASGRDLADRPASTRDDADNCALKAAGWPSAEQFQASRLDVMRCARPGCRLPAAGKPVAGVPSLALLRQHKRAEGRLYSRRSGKSTKCMPYTVAARANSESTSRWQAGEPS